MRRNDLVTATGERLRFFPVGQLQVPSPRVEVAGDRLIVPGRAPDGDSDWKAVEAPDDLLRRFVALTGAKDEKILGFARRWGLLGLCEHGLPSEHNREIDPY